MKKVFMTCYGGGHVRIIEPLYHQLKDCCDVTILALTTAGDYLESKGVPFVRLSDFPELSTSKSISYGEQLSANMSPSTVVPYKETVVYMGCSYAELVEEYGEEGAVRRYEESGRQVFLPIKTFRFLLDKFSPDLVITTNSPRGERASLIAAKQLKIPALCINDGVWLIGGGDDKGVLDVAQQNLADTICVCSESVKDKLLAECPESSATIVVTGSPAFDFIKKLERKKTTVERAKVILYADWSLPVHNGEHNYPDLRDELREELNRLALEKSWDIIFRPHPSQEYSYDEYENVKVSLPSESLHNLLMEVDVVVTSFSTVGLEGRVAGTGLVSLENTIFSEMGSYADLGLSTGIYSVDELEAAIESELGKLKVKYALYEGIASEHIAQIVLSQA
ncbi:CDP-glycerol glycerophosphotransferase family protein [Halodesulfovibrio marinisediminis]|uniref:CDP-Glycerol:Poly(Glycerophosphate) glycerophosphotransferase n=1 Tax=Halodesulfovibrio marinisediminis DSM 17456 TaxID=1121457 RepID=A0A1N6FT08_9BACT|nr:CDP-glycerol glycerophosphotransferase family protein [Halodesulfovibrio marinisediminis]SIN98383.1 CDP-Glycerol:Poly(glycerophosphate) glycerophosphotransferase [Halodesulfovibrio marinisediminis DSM 17456]